MNVMYRYVRHVFVNLLAYNISIVSDCKSVTKIGRNLVCVKVFSVFLKTVHGFNIFRTH
jgi:hypothetical protein